MSDFNSKQKIVVVLSFALTLIFFLYAIFVTINSNQTDGILGVSATLKEEDKTISVASSKIINLNKNANLEFGQTEVFSYGARILYENNYLNIISGDIFLKSYDKLNLEIANNLTKIIEPGIFYIRDNIIYVFSGTIKVGNEDYVVGGQKYDFSDLMSPISLINENELQKDYNFKKTVYDLYESNNLDTSLNNYAPIPRYIRSL